MFHGQFGQGQGQQVSNWPKTIYDQYTVHVIQPGFRLLTPQPALSVKSRNLLNVFMFEGKIPNDSKVIAVTRNHTDEADEDDDDDRTK